LNKLKTISLIIMVAAGSGWAQSTNISTLFHSNFRKAEIFYKKLAYRNAIELYLRELEKKPANTMAKLRIADSYRVLENLSRAEEWYKKAFEEDIPDSYYMYDLAQILSSNEKYTEAREWYNKYRFEVQGDVRPREKIAFIDNMDYYLRDSSLFYVDLANINSEHSDFGSVYFKGGVVFLSSRDQDLFIKHQNSSAQSEDESLLDMYYSEFDGSNKFKSPEKFHKKLNSKFHEGPVTFYENENKVAFTRNNYYQGKEIRGSDGTLNLNIYFAELNEEHELTKLTPFKYNNHDYSTAHPNFSKDGKSLYFSSNLPGGFGGADLYVSHLEDGKWGKPINLEDNEPVREGYALLININPNYMVVNTYSRCEKAIRNLSKDNPEIIFMDLDLPGMDGITGIREIMKIRPDVKIIVITVYEDSGMVFEALCAGAIGYITKSVNHTELLDAIEEVLRNGAPMSSRIANLVVRSFQKNYNTPLSKRETEVLSLLASGQTYQGIAAELLISLETVKSHVKNIYKKLLVNNKTDALKLAKEEKLI